MLTDWPEMTCGYVWCAPVHLIVGPGRTILHEGAKLLSEAVDQFSGGEIQLRARIPDALRRLLGMRVRAEVGCEARPV